MASKPTPTNPALNSKLEAHVAQNDAHPLKQDMVQPGSTDDIDTLLKAQSYVDAAKALPQDKGFFQRLAADSLTATDRNAILSAGQYLLSHTTDTRNTFRNIDNNGNGKTSAAEAGAYLAEVVRLHNKGGYGDYKMLADDVYVGGNDFLQGVKHNLTALAHAQNAPKAPTR